MQDSPPHFQGTHFATLDAALPAILAPRAARCRHRRRRFVGELVEQGGQLRGIQRGERAQHLALGEALNDGVPEAEGGEQAGVRRHQHGGDAEQGGDGAGVLAAGTAEGDQRVVRRIVAAAHGDAADRLRHALVGDGAEAGEERLAAGLGRATVRERRHDSGERGLGGIGVDRNTEAVGVEEAEEEIDVGEGERTAAAVAGRPGLCSGALRPDAQPAACEAADRAAAGRHRLDGERRRHQVGVADAVLEDVLEVAGVARHVGRRAAHVEAEQAIEPRPPSGPRRPRHAAGRSREQAVLGAEAVAPHQAAGAGHHVERRTQPRQRRRHAVQVVAQHRREIRLHHRRLGARQQLDERRQRR